VTQHAFTIVSLAPWQRNAAHPGRAIALTKVRSTSARAIGTTASRVNVLNRFSQFNAIEIWGPVKRVG
jgi:hypothetical protein